MGWWEIMGSQLYSTSLRPLYLVPFSLDSISPFDFPNNRIEMCNEKAYDMWVLVRGRVDSQNFTFG